MLFYIRKEEMNIFIVNTSESHAQQDLPGCREYREVVSLTVMIRK